MDVNSPKKGDDLFVAPVFAIDKDIARVAVVCFSHPGVWELDIRTMTGTVADPHFTKQGARFTMSPEAVDKLIVALRAVKEAYVAALSPAPVTEPTK